jgi:hypothetical protein
MTIFNTIPQLSKISKKLKYIKPKYNKLNILSSFLLTKRASSNLLFTQAMLRNLFHIDYLFQSYAEVKKLNKNPKN